MMCEPEQSVYLEEEKEDVDTEFAYKLVNKENSSYQYTKENEDVDVRSFEYLKDYFAKTNQHGRMEEWKRRNRLRLKFLMFFKLTICV